jgi:hypothetical protein
MTHNTNRLKEYQYTRTQLFKTKYMQLCSTPYRELKGDMSAYAFFREHGILNLDFGRQTGKTTWLASLPKEGFPNVILVFSDRHSEEMYKRRKHSCDNFTTPLTLKKDLVGTRNKIMFISDHAEMCRGTLMEIIDEFAILPSSELVVLI